MTDLAPLVPLLARNADRNGVSQRIRALELEWGAEEGPEELLEKPMDVILGSDVTPFVQSLPDLHSTIMRYTTQCTEIYLSHRDRGDVQFVLDTFTEHFLCESISLPQTISAGVTLLFKLKRRAAGSIVHGECTEEQSLAPHVYDAIHRGDIKAMKRYFMS